MKLSAYQGCTATKKSHENKRNNDEDNKCYDTGNEYLHFSQRSLGSLVIFVLSIWVGLELMARQTMLTKMKVFIAGIVTSVIFIVISLIFMALLGGCASLVGR